MQNNNAMRKTMEMPSWGWFSIIGYMVAVGFLFPSEMRGIALAIGWFVLGGMCVWNYRSCGRIHCSITGPGFLAIGVVTLLDALSIIDLASWMIWTGFGAVMAVGFGLECMHKSKEGTCYSCV